MCFENAVTLRGAAARGAFILLSFVWFDRTHSLLIHPKLVLSEPH